MCRWMGSHFHNWIDYNGVAFSIELLEWGRTFSDFWGKTVLHIISQQTYQNVCIVGVRQTHKQKVTKLGSQKLHFCPKVTEMGSIIGHRIDYNGVGALRGQRHIPSKNLPKQPPREFTLLSSATSVTSFNSVLVQLNNVSTEFFHYINAIQASLLPVCSYSTQTVVMVQEMFLCLL